MAKARLRAAKRDVIISALKHLSYSTAAVPDEVGRTGGLTGFYADYHSFES